MEPTQAIAEAVTNIVKLMVDKPDDVSVEILTLPGGPVFRYEVAPCDIGKLIRVQGRNARSLRVRVAAIGMGAKLRISLDLPGMISEPLCPDQAVQTKPPD
jgi:predicted RNA-binding protein YlqC (UPF0109 family)